MHHDLVISFGANCRNTWNVRHHFGTQKSYPFDWWITPVKSMLAMLHPDFQLDVKASDLKIMQEHNGSHTIYDQRNHTLYPHDFLATGSKIPTISDEQVSAFNDKFRRRFSRLHTDLKASESPLAVIYPAGGWIDRGDGDDRFQNPLNGVMDHQDLIDAVRGIIGTKCRVLIVSDSWGAAETCKDLDGGISIALKDDGTRDPKVAKGHFSEPINVFSRAFEMAGYRRFAAA